MMVVPFSAEFLQTEPANFGFLQIERTVTLVDK